MCDMDEEELMTALEAAMFDAGPHQPHQEIHTQHHFIGHESRNRKPTPLEKTKNEQKYQVLSGSVKISKVTLELSRNFQSYSGIKQKFPKLLWN